MNIIKIIKSKLLALTNDSDQAVSEKLIELATFFYKVDRRISQEEQDFIGQLVQTIDWNSPISAETFQERCIAKINGILSGSEEHITVYLTNLMQELSDLGAATQAKTLAVEISTADNELAHDELKYIELVMSFK
jgi:tRNA A37 N6-isopentenylltransferase MiaA